jgi:DNA-binding CsgD family transcriptional regulator
VSVKTIEVTLTRIYQKTGVHSRAELAHRWQQVRITSDG